LLVYQKWCVTYLFSIYSVLGHMLYVQVAFSQTGVFVHLYIPLTDDDKIIGGTLMIVEEVCYYS